MGQYYPIENLDCQVIFLPSKYAQMTGKISFAPILIQPNYRCNLGRAHGKLELKRAMELNMSNEVFSPNRKLHSQELLVGLSGGHLLKVTAAPGNALIVCHPYHAELAGPGAAVGGAMDFDCRRVIPIGKIALTAIESAEEKQQAYAKRQRWIDATQKICNAGPLKRATQILRFLERCCSEQQVLELPDEIIGQLVGVFPSTVKTARQFLRRKSRQAVPAGGNLLAVGP